MLGSRMCSLAHACTRPGQVIQQLAHMQGMQLPCQSLTATLHSRDLPALKPFQMQQGSG